MHSLIMRPFSRGVAKGGQAGLRPCQLLAMPCHFDIKNPQSINSHIKQAYLFLLQRFGPTNC